MLHKSCHSKQLSPSTRAWWNWKVLALSLWCSVTVLSKVCLHGSSGWRNAGLISQVTRFVWVCSRDPCSEHRRHLFPKALLLFLIALSVVYFIKAEPTLLQLGKTHSIYLVPHLAQCRIIFSTHLRTWSYLGFKMLVFLCDRLLLLRHLSHLHDLSEFLRHP